MRLGDVAPVAVMADGTNATESKTGGVARCESPGPLSCWRTSRKSRRFGCAERVAALDAEAQHAAGDRFDAPEREVELLAVVHQ